MLKILGVSLPAVVLLSGMTVVEPGYAGDVSPVHLPAMLSSKAHSTLLLGMAHAGQVWLAVGAHGVILRSEDEGRQWQQVHTPTSVLLTAVTLADELHGWAVGHEGVILATVDGGRTWVIQHAAEGDDPHKGNPLLAIHAMNNQVAEAVGAYGFVLRTEDGGKTWNNLDNALVNPDQLHFNAITSSATDPASWFVAGEKGQLFHSADAGKTWTKLNSPTDASLFGVSEPVAGELFAYGLGGGLFRSADAGTTWTTLTTGRTEGLNDLQGDRHRLVAVGNGGIILTSEDGGISFTARVLQSREKMDAVLPVKGDAYFAAGEGGIHALDLNSTP